MRPTRRAVGALVAGALAVLLPAPATDAQVLADDPGLARQWGLTRIGAAGAWAAGHTGAGVTIAIVDSGVSPNHPDLVDRLDGVAGLVDCVGHDDAGGGCVTGSGADDAGHGTHVAGIAAATTGNGTGVAGVAPGAHLLSVRALEQVCDGGGRCDAQGTAGDVAEAIRWAADHGAAVINLSLGSATQQILGPAFDAALEYAWDRGAIPVLAAGNTDLPLGTLFGIRAVLVAATTSDDRVASYSGAIGNVDWAVAAPGGEADDDASCRQETPHGILSTWLPSAGSAGYACVAGTSMAAPHVSGALAVLRGAGYEPAAAIERLLATAEDLGPPGRDADFGSGRIDLARALGVSATGGPSVPAGEPTTSVPDDGGSGGGEQPAPVVVADPTTTTAVAAPSTTVALLEPGVTTPPVVDGVAAGLPLGDPGDGSLPAVPLSLAVLAVILTFSGHAWRYLASASWARRTPDR